MTLKYGGNSVTILAGALNKKRPACLEAPRAKFREETPVTRQKKGKPVF